MPFLHILYQVEIAVHRMQCHVAATLEGKMQLQLMLLQNMQRRVQRKHPQSKQLTAMFLKLPGVVRGAGTGLEGLSCSRVFF